MQALETEIEVRSFGTYEEIHALPDFWESNPITKDNYRRIIGDYNFGEEVHCCFQKENGNLCRELHKKGWVAELQDLSITIIGNKCAQDKFGADSRLISDRSKYLNEKRRRERLAVLFTQIQEKASRLRQLNDMKAELKALSGRVQDFLKQVGPQTSRRLQDMDRTGQPQVVVDAVKLREEIDDNGKRKVERSTLSQSLGSLQGLPLASPSSFNTVYAAIADIVQAHAAADQIGQLTKNKEVESLATRLSRFEYVMADGQALKDLEASFFSNNFLLLCFLTTDKTERYKAGKIAMRSTGTTGGKDDAKVWLAEQERLIKEKLGADSIEIR
jgi:hypothetical protein